MLRTDQKKNPGAVLTPTQREFLLGLDEKEGGNERAFRWKIRKRVEESVYDLQLLLYFLDKDDIRYTFEQGCDSRAGPIKHYTPHNAWYSGTGYEDELGYPREGNEASGYDGKSAIGAAIENVIESTPEDSKASPGMQRALVDAVAFLCRASEAGQLEVREVIERGVEKYHSQQNQRKQVVALERESASAARRSGRQRVRNGEKLTRTQMKALEKNDELSELIERCGDK